MRGGHSWVSIYIFLLVAGPGIALAHAKNIDDYILIAEAASSDTRDESQSESEVEKLKKDLSRLGRDLSKAIADGNKKAADAINAAVEKTKKQLKKAMESEKKDQTKNK